MLTLSVETGQKCRHVTKSLFISQTKVLNPCLVCLVCLEFIKTRARFLKGGVNIGAPHSGQEMVKFPRSLLEISIRC